MMRNAALAISLLVLTAPTYAGKYNPTLSPGDAAPNFEKVPGVDGAATASVSAAGAFGEISGATLAHPLAVTSLETTRDGVGTGDPVTPSGVVRANFELLDGAGGEVLVPYSPTVAD